MKRQTRAVLCTAMSVMTAAMALSSVTAANDLKCGGQDVAVANVSDSLLVRASADEESKVVGYIPGAGGVQVKSIGEEWTEVQAGGMTGYVKTDYLAFGDRAEELKNIYGVPGAVASWDNVKIFADYEDTSSIIGTLNAGEGYEVLGSTLDWVEIQLGDGKIAYVPAEDVDTTLVLDTAVVTDGYTTENYAASEEHVPEDYGYVSEEYEYVSEEYEYVPEEYEYVSEEYEYVPEEYEYVSEENTVEEDGYYEEYPEQEYSTGEGYEEDYYDDSYQDDSEYSDTYEEEDTYVDETEFNDGITGDEYVDPTVEDTTASAPSTNYSGSDIDLLAALIYCEAGNQPEEGKIAVGQVVMNRVASSSFANSISGVIYESGQFTPAGSGWLDSVIGNAPSDCYDAAVAAMNGAGTVGNALYFNGGSGQGIQIGDHQFY